MLPSNGAIVDKTTKMKNLWRLLAIPAVCGILSVPAFAQPMGDYDNHHAWHDADWWHQHDPDWVTKHHPEWVEHHPEWKNEQLHHHDHDRDHHDHDHDEH